jgi:lauroyl/myristoyl acyltransferase
MLMVGAFPSGASHLLARTVSTAYRSVNRRRTEIVISNLLPALEGNRAQAAALAKELFCKFSHKLIDLWRYENGQQINHLFQAQTGWKHFETARAEGRGILLLTVHIGNWEFGAPLLKQQGVDVEVITLAEPDSALTRLRQKARARWAVQTRVLGQDRFGFVEVIRRLESGATVALLMDRPPPPTGVTVELFGQPFQASVSAAELARASGCSLLPVYVPATRNGYAAHMLPPIGYDRTRIQTREARRDLTQRIMDAFEPVIKDHLSQWYHFVPIWPHATDGQEAAGPPLVAGG